MNKEAILRAADWLEANPTKHITGHLARDERGVEVRPASRTAACFCALGRIAHEMKARAFYPDMEWPRLLEALDLTSTEANKIMNTNDAPWPSIGNGIATINSRDLGRQANPEVITLMRKLAA